MGNYHWSKASAQAVSILYRLDIYNSIINFVIALSKLIKSDILRFYAESLLSIFSMQFEFI